MRRCMGAILAGLGVLLVLLFLPFWVWSVLIGAALLIVGLLLLRNCWKRKRGELIWRYIAWNHQSWFGEFSRCFLNARPAGQKNAKKYPARKAAGFFIGFVLDRAFNHAGTQAASADIFSHRSAIFNNSYSLHIRSPFPLGFSMGVRNVIPGNNTLFANLTIFSHIYTSLWVIRYRYNEIYFSIPEEYLQVVFAKNPKKSVTSPCFYEKRDADIGKMPPVV